MKSISGVFMEEKDEYPYMHIMACFAHDLFALAWRMSFAYRMLSLCEGRRKRRNLSPVFFVRMAHVLT